MILCIMRSRDCRTRLPALDLHLRMTGLVKGTQQAAQWSYGSIFVQTELMVEICSESLVRAIGKVLLMQFNQNTNLNP